MSRRWQSLQLARCLPAALAPLSLTGDLSYSSQLSHLHQGISLASLYKPDMGPYSPEPGVTAEWNRQSLRQLELERASTPFGFLGALQHRGQIWGKFWSIYLPILSLYKMYIYIYVYIHTHMYTNKCAYVVDASPFRGLPSLPIHRFCWLVACTMSDQLL